MIIVRAPLRISFVGGGTDLPDFYHNSPGRVISATINKYVYAVINPAPLLKGIYARYSTIENVKSVKELKNDRIRESMLYLKVNDNMEIGTFSDLPVGTGLGGSSSFTVALIKGLTTYQGRRLDKRDLAEASCKVEIDLIKEPIGKQDQYASAFGGFNIFQFNPDESVDVEPILLDYKKKIDLENQMLIFFTGITRKASSVLQEQKSNISSKFKTLKTMAKLVDTFKNKLIKGDVEAMGNLLHQNWLMKKKLASKISSDVIDEVYNLGMRNGAWGGKVLGAGGGGCILFFVPSEKREKIRASIKRKAQKSNLLNFQEIPVKFVHSGVEIVSNSLFN